VIHRRTGSLNESHLGALQEEDVFADQTERSFWFSRRLAGRESGLSPNGGYAA
jgi:hypothetical protein